YEVRLMHKDGHMLNIHVYSSMCMIEGKLLVIGTLIDITQQKVWEEAICESEKKNKAIIKAIPDALIRIDGSGIILEIIRTNESSLLINAATCIGRHLSLVWPAEIAARISQGLERCVATGELQLCEYDRAEGDKVVSKELRMVCYDENEVLLVIRDITERKEMEEILKHISCHDAMTGLYNRFYFEQQFRSSLVESMFPVGIIVADLDGLKLVNDSLGHAEGDKLLCKAARVLSVERKNSMTARIGGDEFIVLLTKTSLLELEEVYGEIEQNIIRCNHKEAGIPLYLSLGMDMGNYGEAIDEIFRRADDAMYWQKGKKRAETTASIQQAVAAAQSNMCKEDESE
ncbi:MAG: GGDEF domain-containing protein, partial [Selenomonadaceae bacterium]